MSASLSVNGATTLPAAYLNIFFTHMIEFVGIGGTLTTATHNSILNYESSNTSFERGGITTLFNGCSGSITLAAGTGVTLRGNLVIPAGKCATVRISINSVSAIMHVVVSA
jgi:hypothetical protein